MYCVRQKFEVSINGIRRWDIEESRMFARAIHGHPNITRFQDSGNFPYESVDSLYSALASLPALESINLRQTTPMSESALVHTESLTELLRVPSLRSACFDSFNFTPAFCQATANALIEGTAITKLEFNGCSFSTGECADMMANGLCHSLRSCRRVIKRFFSAPWQ